VDILRAEQQDLQAIAGLQLEAQAALARLAPAGLGQALREPRSSAELEEEFSDMLELPEVLLFVAAEDSAVRGFALGLIEDWEDDLLSSPFMTVQYLVVAPAARRRGIAQALLGRLEAEARSRRIAAIDIIVWENNAAALALYAEQGYTARELRLVKQL